MNTAVTITAIICLTVVIITVISHVDRTGK